MTELRRLKRKDGIGGEEPVFGPHAKPASDPKIVADYSKNEVRWLRFRRYYLG